MTLRIVRCAFAALLAACGGSAEDVPKTSGSISEADASTPSMAPVDAGAQLATCEMRAGTPTEPISLSFVAQCLPGGDLEATGVVGKLRVHMASGAILGGKITFTGITNQCDAAQPATLEFSQQPGALPVQLSEGQSVRVKVTGHQRLGLTNELAFVRVWNTDNQLLGAAYKGLPADRDLNLDTQDLGFSANVVRECVLRTDVMCFKRQTRLALDIAAPDGAKHHLLSNDTVHLELNNSPYALVLYSSFDNFEATGQCSDNVEGPIVYFALQRLE